MDINGLQVSAERLLSLVFPASCRLCCSTVRPREQLCPRCRDELPWLENGCTRCSLPLPAGVPGALCGRCQQHPPGFDHTLALFHYQPPLDYLIKRLKFSSELAICPFFSGLLLERIVRSPAPLPDLLLPVPLHYTRLRERGFNQSTELARRLGRALGIRVDYRLCLRTRSTLPQSLLPRAERGKNMRGAFKVRKTPAASHIAIIDDVMTTGHTGSELARTLKRAGAKQVDVWVLARAGGQSPGRQITR
jgi:ComF family protein